MNHLSYTTISTVLLLVAFIVLADSLIRVVLLFRLAKRIERKGDYRPRHTVVEGSGARYVITLLGASSIYGEGSDAKTPFVSSFVESLAKQGRTVVVHNLAVSGHRTRDVVSTQVSLMTESDLIVVYIGTKDCMSITSAASFTTALRALASALRHRTVIWVTVGDPRLLWLLPVWLRWISYVRAKKFNKLLRRIVSRYSQENWTVVDFFTHGMREAKQRALSPRRLVSDGIHLSDEGQALVGAMISEAATQLMLSKR